MRLILVRHGEAYAGFHGPIAGPTGCRGLTPEGRRQAEALRDHLARVGRRLRPTCSSPASSPAPSRPRRSSPPASASSCPATDCDLCEVHTGEADGTDWSSTTSATARSTWRPSPTGRSLPAATAGTASTTGCAARSTGWPPSTPTQTVVAVCHAGVIIASMRLLLGIVDPSTSAHLQPTNTGLTEWEHQPEADRWLLHGYNDAGPPLRGARGGGATDGSTSSHPRAPSCRRARRASAPGSVTSSQPRQRQRPARPAAQKDLRYWVGPIRVRLDQLNRLAGPPGHPVLETVDEDDWRDDVDDLPSQDRGRRRADPGHRLVPGRRVHPRGRQPPGRGGAPCRRGGRLDRRRLRRRRHPRPLPRRCPKLKDGPAGRRQARPPERTTAGRTGRGS